MRVHFLTGALASAIACGGASSEGGPSRSAGPVVTVAQPQQRDEEPPDDEGAFSAPARRDGGVEAEAGFVGLGRVWLLDGTGGGVAMASPAPGKVQVRPGVPTSSGRLTAAEIQRTFRPHLPKLRACYDALVAKSGPLDARLRLDFVIGSDGKVTGTTGTDSSGHAELDVCVAGALQTMRFPKPAGGGVVKVSYPFVFSST